MNGDHQRKLAMATRVRSFLARHPFEEPAHQELASRLATLLGRVDTLVLEHRTGTNDARGGTAQRKEVKTRLHEQLLPHLVRVANLAAGEVPGLAKHFQLPRLGSTNLACLTGVRAMVAEAREWMPTLQRYGITEPLVADIERAVAEYTAALEQSNAGRARHVGARAELEVVMGKVRELVAALDGIHRYRFRDDPDAWTSAVNVLGPFRRTPDQQDEPAGPAAAA